ncbi:endonuclease/exonuclease/phosphatase family protein [bacterium]|nr:endonuclease/exonuclease/phosphatase family protein [bacterium]
MDPDSRATQAPCLRVLTLNAAHGRRRGVHQLLVSRRATERNLADIAAMLRREAPHVVALQEADGPSFWSGNFDHVAHLAELAGYAHHFRGEHLASGFEATRLSTGTALLSRVPLGEAVSERFAASLPTPRKGVVLASVPLPDGDGAHLATVASVHLDFLRRRVRRRQMRTLVGLLQERQPPTIVLGDLNCSWVGREKTLHTLAEMLGLHAFRPTARDLDTFPARSPRRRLDWILVSPELAFRSCRVLHDPLSDHCAVMADLVRR